jgi:hypothetical protein
MFCIDSFHAHKADPKEFVRRRDGISSRVRGDLKKFRGARGVAGQKHARRRLALSPRKIFAGF